MGLLPMIHGLDACNTSHPFQDHFSIFECHILYKNLSGMKKRLLLLISVCLIVIGLPVAVMVLAPSQEEAPAEGDSTAQTATSPILRALAWLPRQLAVSLEYLVTSGQVRELVRIAHECYEGMPFVAEFVAQVLPDKARGPCDEDAHDGTIVDLGGDMQGLGGLDHRNN